MLQDRFVSVLDVQTTDELQTQVVRFARQLGFDTVSAMVVVDHLDGTSDFFNVHNTPAGYQGTFDDQSSCDTDPVAQHCKAKNIPIVWGRQTYEDAGAMDKWDVQSAYGYCYGIAVVFHLPRGLHFVLGADRDQPLPRCKAEVSRMAAELQLFASHAQESATRLFLPANREGHLPSLTSRELECLRWTMEGKTAWEIGRILGISEQTVARHVHHAARKLDCVNKHQAALKALRLDLIR